VIVRGKWRFVVALVLATLQIAGWIALAVVFFA
jgi:hypothetical protein